MPSDLPQRPKFDTWLPKNTKYIWFSNSIIPMLILAQSIFPLILCSKGINADGKCPPICLKRQNLAHDFLKICTKIHHVCFMYNPVTYFQFQFWRNQFHVAKRSIPLSAIAGALFNRNFRLMILISCYSYLPAL